MPTNIRLLNRLKIVKPTTEYYTEQDAKTAIFYAREIIKWVREKWRLLREGKERGRR